MLVSFFVFVFCKQPFLFVVEMGLKEAFSELLTISFAQTTVQSVTILFFQLANFRQKLFCLACDANDATDKYVECLKMRIDALESRVDGLETSSQEQEETISTLKGQCDAVQEALGTCGSD